MERISPLHYSRRHSIEPLEARIAPAALLDFGTAVHGSPLRLDADPTTSTPAGLSTSAQGGAFLLYVEKGSALVFTTDLNNDGQVDFNEITGIAAGDGLSLISFVDIHGDIVTNLNADFTLTDSDNNAANGLDGRVLLNNKIESVVLRSVTQEDVSPTQSPSDRLALSSYSIYGNIFSGGTFGSAEGGLIVDTTGAALQLAKFTGVTGVSQSVASTPEIGSIRVGSAASGQIFNFGYSAPGQGLGFQGANIRGELQPFVPKGGQDGADIINVRPALDTMLFNLGTLQAGNGGAGARGGDVIDIRISGDTAGGYKIIAGDAGDGPTGQRGGNIMNFADLGSVTSEVFLRAGDGGNSSLGAGGAGGVIAFSADAPQNINGRFRVELGDGGSGLTSGGNGGSQPVAQITTPEGLIPVPLSLVSTTRIPGDIHVSNSSVARDASDYHVLRGFDFDLDGANDLVYTTNNPSQLVVLFGIGNGNFDPLKTLYLNAPTNAEAITVADFNGDGRPDIAAASNDASFSGIKVFTSDYDVLTGEFVGFKEPVFSPLPALTNLGFLQKPVPVLAMASGDFDNDGAMDIAVVTTETDQGSLDNFHVVTILRNDTAGASPNGSGFFYADFRGLNDPVFFLASDPFLSRPIIKATALSDGGPEVLIAGEIDKKALFVADYSSLSVDLTALPLGKVDTNREISDPGKMNKITLEDATIQDFTILDVDNDGDADIVTLTRQPQGFLVTYERTATGFVIGSNEVADSENSGIKLSEGADKGGLGFAPDLLVGILPTNADNDGDASRVNDVAIVDFSLADGFQFSFVTEVIFTDFATATRGDTFGLTGLIILIGMDENILAFDTYLPAQQVPEAIQYNIGYPLDGDAGHDVIVQFGDLVNSPRAAFGIPLANNGVFATAGNGGAGLTGSGGLGGTIGKALEIINGVPVGSFDILLPVNRAYEGIIDISAGNGGAGFINGGDGGRVVGVTVNYLPAATVLTSTVSLTAGNGGGARTGTGGKGGDLSSFSLETGSGFAGGKGGDGVFGGNGGSILGSEIPDGTENNGAIRAGANAEDSAVVALAGNGGKGIKRGGNGGSVTDFTTRFLPLIGGEGGLLYYEAGNGGIAVSGPGGSGGSIIDSGPVQDDNNLVGDIYVRAGNGGRGTSGGNAGSVRNFVNTPGGAGSSIPTSLTVIAGNGGAGTSGNGGAAGDVVDVTADANGINSPLSAGILNGTIYFVETLFNRVIAGNGGDSSGARGAAGGAVTNVISSATNSSFVAAAGRGGDGLLAGGKGGNLSESTLNASASVNSGGFRNKLLVIAGDGGDVYNAPSSTTDPLAFGEIVGKKGNSASGGKAGDGGSISSVTQPASQQTHTDLIAGNGGNTVNYGTTLSFASGVGNGGSISKVTLAGDAGNVSPGGASDPSSAIKSYNDIYINERVADFVGRQFLFDPVLGGSLTALDDRAGNVGIVVGGKGRVRDNNGDGLLDPSTAGQNGSLNDIEATNIMSAVADSVDRIAAIREVNNVRLTSVGGVFGADKRVDSYGRVASGNGVIYSPLLDYLTYDNPDTNDVPGDMITEEDMHTSTPVLGGKLVDGAIVGSNQRTKLSVRDFILG